MIKKIIESAPKPNMRFLKVLLKMLRNVLNNGPTNNMPARAIASIFAPILCLSPALFGIMVSDSEYIFTGLETAPVENQVKEETVNVEPNDFVEPLSPNRRRKKPTDKAKREKLAQSFTSEEVQEIDESLKGVNGAVEIKIENTDEGVMNNSEERDEIIPQPPKMEQLDRPITGRARSRSINK